MIRNKKVVKLVLEWARDLELGTNTVRMPKSDKYGEDEVEYHVRICILAGFLEGSVPDDGGRRLKVNGLTWEGHDLLENGLAYLDI